MATFNLLHHLKLPPDEFGLSAKRTTVLSSRLTIVILLVTVLSCMIGEVINVDVSRSVVLSLIGSSLLFLTLNVFGYYKCAKIIGLFFFNFILYNVCASEPYECGTHIHLLTVGFAALVLFGHEDRKWGIAFVSISLILYLLSYFHLYSFLPQRSFSKQMTNIFFFSNSLVFGIVNVYLVKMLLTLNYKVEGELQAKNLEVVQHNNELLKTNAELDRFVYSASHDLRAPLTSILGLINLQKMDRPSSDIYLDKISDRVHIMDKFIHDIIDYSRNNRLQVVNEEIQIDNLLNEICEKMKFSQHHVEPKIQVNVNEQERLVSDGYRLRVVLHNLVSNAFKYSDPRKVDPFIRVTAYRHDDKFTIEVEDNGIGIEPEYQAKVFDMFYRATASKSGSGLGLYIARESLKMINGTISVESKPGEGSSFKVTIPTLKLN